LVEAASQATDLAVALPAGANAPATNGAPPAAAQAPVAPPLAPNQPKADAQPVSAPASAQPVVVNATPQTAEQQQSQPQPQPQAQPQQAPAPVAAQPATAPAAPATAPAAAPPADVAARPALPTATPVPLARAAEAVEHVLRVATSRGGVTHARIALRPAELGSIDVHIRSTAEGLVARIVAHTAQTVQTLEHAANDLRHSLEEQGLNLKSLDIGQPGEREAGRAGADARGHAPGTDESVATDGEDTTTETLRLPSGVLVDVLA
jgi:flagellar hook-length control protein FliK